MTSSLVPVTDPQLPALSPDLILVRRGGAGWAVETLSERLAEWCGLAASAAVGRSLQVLFPDMIPSLTELADEVVGDDRDIGSAKVQLRPDSPALLADLQFSGLTDDYRGHRVQIFFRQPSIASQHERGFRSLIGQSAAMREVFRKIRLYAGSDAAVIITGETGAGKELVAKALHEESARARAPYAALNCTAISEQLLESELFGHERGAFTGAVRDHRGYFEQADGGTLFLDEIGDMPLHTQGKLLRVLEDGNVQRV
ncbi:MAG: sigma-54-dependent Fis family transcriptional regulator, partial [Desulfuromonas sp.]